MEKGSNTYGFRHFSSSSAKERPVVLLLLIISFASSCASVLRCYFCHTWAEDACAWNLTLIEEENL